MTDEKLFDEAVAKSGLKLEYLAEKCGISRQSLWQKKKNLVDFKVKEVDILCDALGIRTLTQMKAIFFAQEVVKNGN